MYANIWWAAKEVNMAVWKRHKNTLIHTLFLSSLKLGVYRGEFFTEHRLPIIKAVICWVRVFNKLEKLEEMQK